MVPYYLQQQLRGELEELKNDQIKPNFSALARKYSIDRHTIAKYWKDGRIRMKTEDNFPTLFDSYFDEIKEKAESTVCSKKALYEYFHNKYGNSVFHCYSTFAHYLQRKELRRKMDMKVHLRYETPPGHQLQLDWKENLKTTLKDGSVISYHLFVATFGYSRYHYYIYSKTKTTEDFLRCLIEVLRRAGGIPEQLITDNMTAVVNLTGGSKNKVPLIKQFEKDVGVMIHLCKIRTPQTKGKVESANRYAQWLEPYNGELTSEQELIECIQKLNIDVNNETNSTTGIPPVKLIRKEMEHLRPIPNKILIESYVQNVSVQTVPPTLLIRYKGSDYSVPPKFIGKQVKAVPVGNKLYIYYNNELITVHNMDRKKIRYEEKDYIDGLRKSMPAQLSDNEIRRRAEENLAMFDQLEEMKYE